jgi:hypothetical protein
MSGDSLPALLTGRWPSFGGLRSLCSFMPLRQNRTKSKDHRQRVRHIARRHRFWSPAECSRHHFFKTPVVVFLPPIATYHVKFMLVIVRRLHAKIRTIIKFKTHSGQRNLQRLSWLGCKPARCVNGAARGPDRSRRWACGANSTESSKDQSIPGSGQVRFISTRPKSRTMRAKRKKNRSRANRTNVPK